MKTYYKRLRGHPGVPVAGLVSFLFPLAGVGDEKGWLGGVIAGLVAAAVVWAIVLWTARTQPIREEEL